jgi:xanthine dehydrogenase accessory factor
MPHQRGSQAFVQNKKNDLSFDGGKAVPDQTWLDSVRRTLKHRRPAFLATRIEGAALGERLFLPESHLHEEIRPGLTTVAGAGQVYLEPILPSPRLLILGAGHIAVPLAAGARLLGFSVAVLDDRPALLRPDRFPPGTDLRAGEWAAQILALDPGPFDAVLLATRAHGHDLACLEALVGRPLAWLGMVGSYRRVAQIRETLLAAGVDAAWLDGLRAPVGLDIGAETPAEIAVAILGELVLAGRGGSGAPLSGAPAGPSRGSPAAGRRARVHTGRRSEQTDWPALLSAIDAGGGPVALATIIRTWGHSPRAPGAKMLLWRDGRSWGSIGGGCGEAEVRRAALDALEEGRPRLYEVNLLDHPEERDGAICGGRYLVLIEPLEVDVIGAGEVGEG